MVNTKQEIDTLNSLLHVEMAAEQNYRHALSKTAKSIEVKEIEELHQHHLNAVNLLKKEMERLGKPVKKFDHVQKNIATLVELSINPWEDLTALKALEEGESQTITGYQNALHDQDLDQKTKHLIESELLPGARKRLPILNRILKTAVKMP